MRGNILNSKNGSILNQLPYALAIVSTEPLTFPGPQVLFANKKFLRLVKLKAIPQKISLCSLKPFASDILLINKLQAAKTKRQSINFKLERSGSKKCLSSLEVTIMPLFNDDNILTSFAMTFLDISNYQQLNEKDFLNTQIFNYSNEAVMVTDMQFNILSVNNAFSAITGYTKEEIYGITPSFIKPTTWPLLMQDLKQSLEKTGEWKGEIECQRKNGQTYCIWLTTRQLKNKQGTVTHFLSIFNDISAIKRTEEHLFHLSHYDNLTGMANRHLFKERLDQAIIQTKRTGNHFAVIFLDLDGFKLINETLGHQNGDLLLTKVAARIKNCLRDSDTLGRMGGDDFMIILNHLKSPLHIISIVQKIIRCFQQAFVIGKQELFITASLGIALYPDDGTNNDALMKNADTAVNEAKAMGKNTYRFYSPELNNQLYERMILSNMLRKGIEQNEFIVYYQPQFDIHSQSLCSVEALVRWQNKEQGLLAPYKFIHVAEETGLIVPLGELVLRQACVQGKRWQDLNLLDFKISINLSARQFKHNDMIKIIRLIIEETGFNAQFLEFEITESVLIEDNIPEVVKTLIELKEMGASIVIDDFGTGYSSLSYLHRFPIDKLKIDKAFIQDIQEFKNNTALASAIIALGKSLKLQITAEGVETESQLSFLKEKGCNQVQGFYFSPPLPAHEFEELLLKRKIKMN